jgi:Methyltransferase domain
MEAPDQAEAPVQKNAARGAWRAIMRTAKRPVLAALLLGLRRLPLEELTDPRRLQRLRWAWGNPNSAAVEYLVAVTSAASTSRGPILECGSGLTTVLLGAVARRTGGTVTTLEHSSWWARHVRWSVRTAGGAVDYRRVPLRDFGEFEWYDSGPLPDGITLVVCDGPPATSGGGRFGLMPTCSRHLAAGAQVFLDDFERESEQAVAARWENEFGCRVVRVSESAKGAFCRIETPVPPAG